MRFIHHPVCWPPSLHPELFNMKLSDQRLHEIIIALSDSQDIAEVRRDEWQSIATELRQLRLRTSSQSRTAIQSVETH